ncbi:MAG: DNA polymerase III subunit delta' [Actinomycetaceae bacterium]|nr:DNA polymerase III subunit delta' [Actinomycetaceae bacterium]
MAEATPGGGVWAEVAGQTAVIASFMDAARAARVALAQRGESEGTQDLQGAPPGIDEGVGGPQDSGREDTGRESQAMTHAWLVTGPPGSGRSVAALAFAAALECTNPETPGCGHCEACRQVMGGTHPDVTVVTTDKVLITIDEVRELVNLSVRSPSSGRWRVILVEDYDRIDTRSSNVLLKFIEEPPPATVWLLCVPSPADVMPTIRSRCRLTQLRVPSVESVAELLVRRDGVEPVLARQVAEESGSHIGLARALARDPETRSRREELISAAVTSASTSQAVLAAARIMGVAEAQDKATNAELEEAERLALRASLGLTEGTAIPQGLRGQFKNLEEEQQRRAKRSRQDVIDRAIQDVTSFYRDVLMLQTSSGVPVGNQAMRTLIQQVADGSTMARTLERIDVLDQTRTRLKVNTNYQLILESMCIQLRQS